VVADSLYPSLAPILRHILEVVVENDFEESTVAVVNYVHGFQWPDQTDISTWVQNENPASDTILRGRILEAFAHWVRMKAREMDAMIFPLQACQGMLSERVQSYKRQLEQAARRAGNPLKKQLEGAEAHQASGATAYMEVLAEFLFTVAVEILGRDAACLASFLAGQLDVKANRHDLLGSSEWPSRLLASMVFELEKLQAKICKIVMELYHDSCFQSYDDSKNALMLFFPFYTVETGSGTLEVHESPTETTYADSAFRVNLIDSFGLLLRLLLHLEYLTYGGNNGHEVILAVDFEGVKLCRHGALCLVQMTCSDDPTLVYVLDIYVLGRRAFLLETANGTSMKGLLENESIRKVWFDPRNDVDALYHQFGIMPRGIFDLQLAEVADRRNRGLSVNYVQSLYKCLGQCPSLQGEQKVFAEKINNLGKNLFEPQYGGNYEIFQARPLNPVILVYAAHDSRYMLLLYEHYLNSMGNGWLPRVLRAGEIRARWCLNPNYVVPNSDAPDF
jgi:hypothetical protein